MKTLLQEARKDEKNEIWTMVSAEQRLIEDGETWGEITHEYDAGQVEITIRIKMNDGERRTETNWRW